MLEKWRKEILSPENRRGAIFLNGVIIVYGENEEYCSEKIRAGRF